MTKKNLMLFSGRAHPELAEQVAKQLDVTITPQSAYSFANGEIFVRFEESVRGVLRRARGPRERKVRAFGEMVAVLWAQGHHGAVVRLEHLWQSFCQRSEDMALFCAYPKSGITKDTRSAMEAIFAAHTTVLDGAIARH